MAKKKAEELNQALLQPDEDSGSIPRVRFSEIGTSGLKLINKQIYEEDDKAWRLPNRFKTVDEMCRDEYISAALHFYVSTLAQVDKEVVPPKNASEEQEERTKFIESCFGDMKSSWHKVMLNILTSMKYGFAPIEIILKRRTAANSKHKDGLTGIADLPLRSQHSISGWVFSDDGRELLGVEQDLSSMYYNQRYSNLTKDGSTLVIPIEKLLLFSTSAEGGNPEGTPILKNAHTAFKFKKEVARSEILGVARDLQGLAVLQAPSQLMSANASDAEKVQYEMLKKYVRGISRGEQEGVVLPSDANPDTKVPYFKLDLLSSQGSKNYDTSAIIARLNTAILVGLCADILNVGNGASGSFALVEGKKGIVEFNLRFRLKEIEDVINSKLIPLLYKMNGWSDTEYAQLKFGDIAPVDLDTLSKAVQRIAAVSALEIDREVLNITRSAIGAAPKADDSPIENVSDYTSGAAEGQAEGMPSGTGNADGSSGDSSVANNENV